MGGGKDHDIYPPFFNLHSLVPHIVQFWSNPEKHDLFGVVVRCKPCIRSDVKQQGIRSLRRNGLI